MAGVLHHLGVDMGDIEGVEALAKNAPGNRRQYCGYEDMGVYHALAQCQVNGIDDPLFAKMDQHIQAYLRDRLASANGQPCGVKAPSFVMTSRCPSLTLWPMVVVHADRDVDAAIASDIKYRGFSYERAVERGIMDLALRQFLTRITPVCTIRYEDALVSPRYAVAALVNALDLEPTPDQRQAAIDFIDPVGCQLAERTSK